MLSLIKSQKGRDKLIVENAGYFFHRNASAGKISWSCEIRNCIAIIVTLDGEIVKSVIEHNHEVSLHLIAGNYQSLDHLDYIIIR